MKALSFSRSLWLALLIGLSSNPLGCHVSPPPEVDYVVTDRDQLGTPIGDACLQLRKLGCPEGLNNSVPHTCFEILFGAAQVSMVPVECIKASPSIDDVRSCGDSNTVRVRCVQ